MLGQAPAIKNGLDPLVDGFLYNLYTRYWPERYIPLCLAGMDILRRAASYRIHKYVLPKSDSIIIQPRDTYEEQVSVVPGSFWWGTSFIAMDPVTYASVAPAARFLIRITESCNDVGTMQDFTFAEMYSVFQSVNTPILNANIRPIVEPALLNVEIASVTDVPIPVQLVLYMAEPCQIPQGMYTECEGLP